MTRKVVFLLLSLLCLVAVASAQDVEIQVDSQTGTAYGLAWNPDATILAITSGHELTLYTADLQTILAKKTESESGSPFLNAAWSPDGTQLATVSGYRHGDILLWNWDEETKELELVVTLDGDDSSIEASQRAQNQYGVTWGEAGLISLTDDQRSSFQIWDVGGESVIGFQDSGYTSPLYQFAWSENGSAMIAVGREIDSEDFAIYTMHVTAGNTESLLLLLEQPAAMAISDDYAHVAVAYPDSAVDIIDLAAGETIHTFPSVNQPVAVGWNGNQLAILGYETDLQIWDLSDALP